MVWDFQHLCDTCAQMLGITQTKSVDPLALLQLHAFPTPVAPIKEIICSQCGLKLSEFRRAGRLGCDKCYEAFKEPMNDVIARAHGGKSLHVGRKPGMSGEETSRQEEVAALNRRLRKAIESEAYEEAARMRDRIKSLESGQVP